MNYNAEVKTEIIKNISLDDKAQKAFLSAVVRAGGITIVKKRLNAEIVLDCPDAMPYIAECFKRENVSATVEIKTTEQGARYIVGAENVADLLGRLSILSIDGKNAYKLYSGVPELVSSSEKRAYIIGYFLVAGTISIPSTEFTSRQNGYRVEINVISTQIAEQLAMLIIGAGVDIKVGERRNLPYLYMRDAQQIADFLALVGANDAMFELQNVSILKNTKNELNRVNNCAVANMNKTAAASANQRDAISKIVQKCGWEHFVPALKVVAKLRLDNPTATLDELAELCEPKISKSGIKHRLSKIIEIANSLPN